MVTFETRPVRELKQKISPLRQAFAELPQGDALFVPQASKSNRPHGWVYYLERHHPDRKVHSHWDQERRGAWIWWTEKGK